MKNITLNSVDKEILSLLQADSDIAIQDIAEKVGLTATPCWRRIQRLQEQGLIQRRVALLDAQSLGLNLTVFVQVKAARHDDKWLTQFAEHCSAFEEVVEFYRMSGEYDYLLKVMVADMQRFDHFYKRLIKGVNLGDVTSSFAMEQIKYTTSLPLNQM